MGIEYVRKGDRPRADHMNEVVGSINGADNPLAAKSLLKEQPRIALFILTEAVQLPDDSDPDAPECPFAENAKMLFVYASGTTKQGLTATVYFPWMPEDLPCVPFGEGARLFAIFSPQSGRWEALAPHGGLKIQFELKTAKTPGNSATAYVRVWSGSDYVTDTDYEVTVYDRLGKWRGRAKDAYSSPNDAGSRGVAEWDDVAQRLEIVDMQPHALMIRGLATADFTDADGNIDIDGVDVMQPIGGLIANTDPAGNVNCTNDTGFSGDNNAVVKAVWNEDSARYEISDVPCPA